MTGDHPTGQSMVPTVTARAIKLCDGWVWPGMASFLTTCPGPERCPTSRGGTEARGMHQVHFYPASVGAISDAKSHMKDANWTLVMPPLTVSLWSTSVGAPLRSINAQVKEWFMVTP